MDYKTVDDVHRGDIIDCDLRSCSFIIDPRWLRAH